MFSSQNANVSVNLHLLTGFSISFRSIRWLHVEIQGESQRRLVVQLLCHYFRQPVGSLYMMECFLLVYWLKIYLSRFTVLVCGPIWLWSRLPHFLGSAKSRQAQWRKEIWPTTREFRKLRYLWLEFVAPLRGLQQMTRTIFYVRAPTSVAPPQETPVSSDHLGLSGGPLLSTIDHGIFA